MAEYKDLVKLVDKNKNLVFKAEKYLWKHPETGYKEWKSSAYLEKEYEKLGYELVRANNIPGFYTDLDTGLPGPKILILSELDSLLCNDHPDADPVTGAVHACGHSAQGAALLGVAAALKERGALDGLCGSVRLCAVPAEELIETGYRETLKEKGIIKYYGGKIEFLYRGYFNGTDIAYMIHTSGGKPHSFSIQKGNNGCIVKNIKYKGVAAHAGGAPHSGINALYAANIGITAVNALRETFIDDDHIRVHPIITAGGTAVNAIPSEVKLESYVRGATVEAINLNNKKVNRALSAGAAALGAKVELCDRPGYAPLINDKNLAELMEKAMKEIAAEENVSVNDSWGTGCTDMGDISAVMPAVHPYVSGASGEGHGNNFKISDAETACLDSAKAQLVLLNMLLRNGAEKAKYIIDNKELRYGTYEEYFEAIDKFMIDKDAVIYNDDGKVVLDI